MMGFGVRWTMIGQGAALISRRVQRGPEPVIGRASPCLCLAPSALSPLLWPSVWAMHARGAGAAGHMSGVTPTSCSCDGGLSALSPLASLELQGVACPTP